MNVAIIGTGYVGLTTGLCLADFGHKVLCIDNDQSKLDKLQAGIAPIFEPGLSELLVKTIASLRVSFDNDIAKAVRQSEVIFICVNTPPKPDGQADLKY